MAAELLCRFEIPIAVAYKNHFFGGCLLGFHGAFQIIELAHWLPVDAFEKFPDAKTFHCFIHLQFGRAGINVESVTLGEIFERCPVFVFDAERTDARLYDMVESLSVLFHERRNFVRRLSKPLERTPENIVTTSFCPRKVMFCFRNRETIADIRMICDKSPRAHLYELREPHDDAIVVKNNSANFLLHTMISQTSNIHAHLFPFRVKIQGLLPWFAPAVSGKANAAKGNVGLRAMGGTVHTHDACFVPTHEFL